MPSRALESHGKLVPVSAQAPFRFHLVFSNKTESDAYCLGVWGELTARGVQVWQQQKNIPKGASPPSSGSGSCPHSRSRLSSSGSCSAAPAPAPALYFAEVFG